MLYDLLTLIFLQTLHAARNARIREWRVSTSNHRIFQRMSGGCSRPSGARRSPRSVGRRRVLTASRRAGNRDRHRDPDRSAWRPGRDRAAWSFHAACSSSPGTSRHPTARTGSRRRSMSPNARSAGSRGSSASTGSFDAERARRDAERRRVARLAAAHRRSPRTRDPHPRPRVAMRILFIGDIFGKPGREIARRADSRADRAASRSTSSSPTSRTPPPASASPATSPTRSSTTASTSMTIGQSRLGQERSPRLHPATAEAAAAGELPGRRARPRQVSRHARAPANRSA